MITLSSHVALSPNVVFQELKGEAVLLDMAQETYFGLDEVGTFVWQRLSLEPSLRAAYAAALDAYDVAADQLERDVIAFVERLNEAGLVQIGFKPGTDAGETPGDAAGDSERP